MPFARTFAFRHFEVFRGGPEDEGAFVEYSRAGRGGDGRARRAALDPGQRGPGPGRALELQGGQVRLVQRRGQRQAALTCKTRLSDLPSDQPIMVEPMRTFPLIKDLVTDVSWNYEVNKRIHAVHAAGRRAGGGVALAAAGHRARPGVPQVHRVLPVPGRLPRAAQPRDQEPFVGPRFLVRVAGLEMHPMDGPTARKYLKDEGNIGYCNITKCCTEVCPEHIKITDNAIIPLKERVADAYYDPVQVAWRRITRADREQAGRRGTADG